MVDRIVYSLYRLIAAGLSWLPLVSVVRLGMTLGSIALVVVIPYRRVARRNLEIAFGREKSPREIDALLREHFRLLGGNLLASVRMMKMEHEETLRTVKIENAERIEAAYNQGRGVIFAISHMANWELIAQTAPVIFRGKASTIYQRLTNPLIDAEVRTARSRLGLTLFERKEGFAKAITLLREGGGVGVLFDQHAGDKGVWSPFFNRLASTTPLVATMALRTGAALIPAALYTEAPGRWRLVISEPVEPSGDDAAVLTARLNLSLETLIRHSPADWFWVHDRWKTPRPNFLLSGYKRGAVFAPGYDRGRLSPFKIVIRSSNWLGDAVMTTPALQAIKRGRPDAHITVLVRAKLADYWRHLPEVDAVIPIEAGESPWSVARKVRQGCFDAAVILPNSVRTALEIRLAGVPLRIGYPAKWRRWLINEPLPPPRHRRKAIPARHQVHHYLELARRIGAEVLFPPEAGPEAFFPTPALRMARRPAREPGVWRLGLCPGAEFGAAKRWLPERFSQTASHVATRERCEWVLFGVGGDAPVGAAIEAAFEAGPLGSRLTNLIGKTSLTELMEMLATCDLLLTNDTGTMHLAAALGVPTVALFGSTEPRLTAPLGPGHQILRHQVECSPCFQRDCPLDFRCMEAITVEEASGAILRVLGSLSLEKPPATD